MGSSDVRGIPPRLRRRQGRGEGRVRTKENYTPPFPALGRITPYTGKRRENARANGR